MALACQRDSYLKEFQTTVKSCTPATTQIQVDGKKEKLAGFEVILDDTILFPEGGGQPDDRGTIQGKEVLRVTRRGAEAVHFVKEELPLGSSVDLVVDWKRRFDHMQQHTGQHLITAMADRRFGFPTTSWSLGNRLSTIELDTPAMTKEQMEELEFAVNEKIRECVPVAPHLYHDKNDPELANVRARGLPEDHEGPVRLLSIEGIDSNLCCGTHVSNLSHLQAIKLLWVEKGKKGKVNLSFVAGGRLLAYLGQSVAVEKELTGILKGPIDQHVELADKAVKNYKLQQKYVGSLLKELAVLEAQQCVAQAEKEKLIVHHKKEGDNDYMNVFVSEVKDDSILTLVTVGDDKGPGLFLLAGPQDRVSELGPKLCQIMDGKGAPSGGKFRAKVSKLSQRAKAEQMLRANLQSAGASEGQA